MITRNAKNEYDITGTNEGVVFGLSTDDKPTDATIYNGYRFVEMDTKREYIFDAENTAWRLWENRNSGEATGVDLNIAGAKAGQGIVVASVDANGAPESWTPIDLATVDGTKLVLP